MTPPTPPKGTPILYEQTKELVKQAYKKPAWNGEKFKRKTGFLLQGWFGKSVWTLKDLDDTQLQTVVEKCSDRLNRSHGLRPISS